MTKSKFHPSTMTQVEYVAFLTRVKGDIEKNPEMFPNSEQLLIEVNDVLNSYNKEHEKTEEMKDALIVQNAKEEEAYQKAVSIGYKVQDFVEFVSNGNEEVVLAAGFELKKAKSSTSKPMPKVEGVKILATSPVGCAKVEWKSIKNALTYQVELSRDINNNDSWTQCGLSSKSSFTIKGLPSGEKVWVRIAAFGRQGEGEWSDPTPKTIL